MMVRGLSTSFLSIRLFFSRAHEKWHETKRKQLFFSETTPSLRTVILCRKGETLFVVFSSYTKKPREQILIERCVLKWNTCTPADEGRTKAAKKHLCLFLLPSFRFRRARDFLKLLLFREEKLLNALSFSFLSHVSLVCFLKKWPKIKSICFGLFFSLQRTQTRAFSTTKPLSHDQFFTYLFINSFTHNNTHYKTTRIKIHHSERRRKKTQTRSCLLLLYLSRISAVVVWTTQKSARVCSFLFLKAKFIKSSFCPLWII